MIGAITRQIGRVGVGRRAADSAAVRLIVEKQCLPMLVRIRTIYAPGAIIMEMIKEDGNVKQNSIFNFMSSRF